ncbi:sporulation integral membrane protein YlbJ [Oceanobacillus halophilus]|uniref:Sporulation integral membrane protein YlbJ n=1 Tax=Oceanobacillus halophilus TaxID=930130 RepID=A0A495ABH3_9BACI|nr:sporulation integral membrane protein YlbJ [Oceanobacillus halophilus]RKQ37381.1 sporulation integral membrane protein YlbJ [Oceanobacillus halophilus]
MKQIIKTLIYSSITIFITISLIKFPDPALEASIRGLNLWWEVVFPSLLPFFITAELLLSFGVVKFIGVLFEPIMRPLFNIPGVGSFGWMMGMASGYPTGAKIASRLREEKHLTKVEAERLVSFTNNSSPLFIFGAISVGFFHDARLGILLATCHYVGNAIVGISMRFYGRREEKQKQKEKPKGISFKRAFQEMHETRVNDKRPLGEILGDAVLNSIKTLVMVGGFIVLFSVLIKILFLVGVSSIIAAIFELLLIVLSLPSEYALPFFSGLFEITIGADMISKVASDTLLQQAVLISFILGFNGFSVQAQVASILAKTDIRFAPYFYARILHGTIASFLTIILYKPLYLNKQTFEIGDIPVSSPATGNIWITSLEIIKDTGPIITFIFLAIGVFLVIKRNRKDYKQFPRL